MNEFLENLKEVIPSFVIILFGVTFIFVILTLVSDYLNNKGKK